MLVAGKHSKAIRLIQRRKMHQEYLSKKFTMLCHSTLLSIILGKRDYMLAPLLCSFLGFQVCPFP